MDKRNKNRRKEIIVCVLLVSVFFLIASLPAVNADVGTCSCDFYTDDEGFCMHNVVSDQCDSTCSSGSSCVQDTGSCSGSCTCVARDPDYHESACSTSCFSDATPGDDGVHYFSGSDYSAGDADKEGNCCGDDSGEYYIDSTGGGTACCDSGSDCGTSDHYCKSNGYVDNSPNDGLLCNSSDFLICGATTGCGAVVSVPNLQGLFECQDHDWSSVTCDSDACVCASSYCAGEDNHFIPAGSYYNSNDAYCCMGTTKYIGDVEVGGQGTNDCGTLDGVSYDDCIVEGHTAVS